MNHDHLKQAIRRAGLTQNAIADYFGVDVNTVWRWVAGRSDPTDATKRRLAELLGTSVAYLLGETDDDASAQGREGEPSGAVNEGKEGKKGNAFEASDDLDQLISDLARHNPDLIVMFRDTTRKWSEIPDRTKAKIAAGMKFVLELGELDENEFRTPKSDRDL